MSFWLLRTLGLPFSIPLLLTAPCSCTPIHTPQKRFGKRGTFLEVSFHLKGLRTVSFLSLQLHELYSPWNSPGQNTKVGRLSLLQGIFPQGLNPGLPHCRWTLYQLNHKGSPRILEWVSYPFSSRSSSPRNRTRVSRTAGRFFTNWAMREALLPLGSWTLLIQDLIKKKNKHSLSSGKWLVVTDTDC